MASFEPFNLGQVFATAEGIKAARAQATTDRLREQYLGLQIQGAQDEQSRAKRNEQIVIGQQKAKQIVAKSEQILQQPDGAVKNYVEQYEPDLVKNLANAGVDWQTVDEPRLKQMVAAMRNRANQELGSSGIEAPIKVGAGDTLIDPRTRQTVYSAPPDKGSVEWVDLNDRKVPKYSKTGADVPGLSPMAKGLTPGQRSAQGDGLSDAAKQLAVDRLLAGEKPSSVLANLGRGGQGAKDLRAIQNLLADTAKARGISGPMVVKIMQSTAADGRAVLELGAREGKIAARVQEAQNFAQIAKAASAEVPRSKFIPYNKLKQMTQESLSDPALARLKAATVSLINAYAAAVGGGTPTVHDKEAAENMLSTAQGPEAYDAVVDQLITETEQALAAPEQVRERMTGIKPQHGSDLTPEAKEVTATGPNGEKVVLRNGQWVPK